MPLPDAPPPKTSRVYQQLTGKTLSDVVKADIDQVYDPVFIDRNAEDEIRRLKLIGELTGHISSAGYLADTGGYKLVSESYDTAGPILLPPVGEVWDIQLLIVRNGTDVTLGLIPQLASFSTPGDTSSLENAEYLLDSATSVTSNNDLRLTNDLLGLSQDLILTSTMGLRLMAVSGSPTSGTKQVRVFYSRVR